MEIATVIDELLPLYKQVLRGKYAIALAGAHAKGSADGNSDLDMFIYTEDVASYEAREAVFQKPGIEQLWISPDIVTQSWGGSIDFVYNGLKVETTIKQWSQLSKLVEECLSGSIRIAPETWTLNGYYNYICLSEIDFVQSIEDSYQMLSSLKEKIKTYPPALKRAILDHFWPKSRMWIDNFHYLSAIERMDIVYTSGIVNQTIHNMTQVLFALNENYFRGDKKLESQWRKLGFCPAALIDNVEILLTARRDVGHLKRQRDILKEVAEEIANFQEKGRI